MRIESDIEEWGTQALSRCHCSISAAARESKDDYGHISSGSYTLGTSCACSCIPEAYLVHRAEGREVEKLDINPYILTFLIKMHTMHTLHTFFIKFI